MTTPKEWHYLAPNPRSHLRQLFVKGTEFAAHDLYVLHIDPEEPMPPEEIAAAFGVPVEAVREAIAYCQSNPPEVQEDFAEQDAWFAAHGLSDPPASKRP